MKKKEINSERYQQLLKDIGAIFKEGQEKTNNILEGLPSGIKNDIFKNTDNPLIKKNKK